MRTTAARWGQVAVVALLIALGGCSSSAQPGPGMSFRNATDVTVLITAFDSNGVERVEPIVHSLDPGLHVVVNDRFLVNQCVDVTLVARSQDGVEVARRAGPICAPGEWVVERQPGASP